MARNTKQVRGISWIASPEATGYLIYVDETDSATFLADVDAGNVAEFDDVTETQYVFPAGFPEDADIAIVAYDDQGRFSDPYSPAAWQDIPLAQAPLAAPTGGELLLGA